MSNVLYWSNNDDNRRVANAEKGKTVSTTKMEDIISLCKRRGFIYQGSDVYGGLSGTWDYGPLGVQLKRNIMNLWWRRFVDERDDMYGVDAAILMNQKVWQASGHVDTFVDPLTVCLGCNSRQRVDKIVDPKDYQSYIENTLGTFYNNQWGQYNEFKHGLKKLENSTEPLKKQIFEDYEQLQKLRDAQIKPAVYKEWLDKALKRIEEFMRQDDVISSNYDYIFVYLDFLETLSKSISEATQYRGKLAQNYLNRKNKNIKCPVCGEIKWSVPRTFNMMFKTHIGATESEDSISYLRPETAQGIFTNFKNVVDSFYPNLPFGIAQQGKAFRNEIAPRDFVFRSRELEQMEIEYFVDPEHWQEAFDELLAATHEFLAELGLKQEHIHELDVPAEDRAHYSKKTIDIEYDYPIGREELMGIAYRTDFDLMNIQRASGKSMEYTVKGTNTKFVPHVIEPSFGVERALMAVLSGAYREDEQNGEKRVYLALPEHLAPVKFAVSPLLKNKSELVEKARDVYAALAKANPGRVMWDDNGNIGKRYRRQDEIGTPHCVVIDFQTLEDDTVTVRERDTTEQQRVRVGEL